MSGPQGSDPGQQWQPPGEAGDQSSEPTQVASSPWQQQPGAGGDVAGPGVHAARRVPAVPTAG